MGQYIHQKMRNEKTKPGKKTISQNLQHSLIYGQKTGKNKHFARYGLQNRAKLNRPFRAGKVRLCYVGLRFMLG